MLLNKKNTFGMTSFLSLAAIFTTSSFVDQKPQAPTPILDKKKMRPEFRSALAGEPVAVDIDLLGPQGGLTVAFVASLDRNHAGAWKDLPEEILKSQDPFDIHAHLRHHELHFKDRAQQEEGMKDEEHIEEYVLSNNAKIEKIYKQARTVWAKKYPVPKAQ